MTTYGMESEPPRCPWCSASLGTMESIMFPRCVVCGQPFTPGAAVPHVPTMSAESAESALAAPDGLDTQEVIR